MGFDHLPRTLESYIGADVSVLKKHLARLPVNVEEAYDRILNQLVDQDRKEVALKMLSIILAAPDPLTPTQLYMALYVSEQTDWDDLSPLPDDSLQTHLR